MTDFLSGSRLNTALEEIFHRADFELILVSPFISLHPRLKDILKRRKENYELEIVLLYGKEGEGHFANKSMKKDDLLFFMEFPNISIYYEERLHAKYYANDYDMLLSSMNLYDYSINNNIEFGILVKSTSIAGEIMSSISRRDIKEFFNGVISNSELVFRRQPVYKKNLLGIRNKYSHSEVVEDKILKKYGIKGPDSKPVENENTKSKSETKQRENTNINATKKHGFCIRTGVEIPFNIEMPMSPKAFKSWQNWSDDEYPEKYCHYSGERSDGETSFSRPILYGNWKAAKKHHNL